MTIDPIYQFDINDLFTVGLIRRKLPETKLGMRVARKVKAERENMRLRRRANQWFLFARPAPDQEGSFAIVTNVGCGMRWTWMASPDERRHRGRRSRVVPISRR